MEPYIKIFKRLTTWEWYKDTNTFRVFMHILLTANYEPKKYKGVTIGRGQCVFGRRAWAEKLGLTERQIRTSIAHLKATNEITITSTNRFSVITVVKWDFWQIENGNRPTNRPTERQRSDQQSAIKSTTSKEYKNIYINNNNAKKRSDVWSWKVPDELPEGPDEQTLKILRGDKS